MLRRLSATCLATIFAVPLATADVIRVAAASNFRHAAEDIVRQFEQTSGHDVELIFGSTGKLFAQIQNGAPFDVYLAADELRPRMLEEDDLIISGSRFVYAIGKLVLWSADAKAEVGVERLFDGDYRFLAVANPVLAPYGKAARQLLVELGVWESTFLRTVQGENVAQAHQFVVTGNADLGLIALAQIRVPGIGNTGAWWEVPQTYYDPIRQQAARISDAPAAREFTEFLQSPTAAAVLQSYGYDVP